MRRKTKTITTEAYQLTWHIGTGPEIHAVSRTGLPDVRPQGSSVRDPKFTPTDLKVIRANLKELEVAGFEEKMSDGDLHRILLAQIEKGELEVLVLPPMGWKTAKKPQVKPEDKPTEKEIPLRIRLLRCPGEVKETGIEGAEWILFRDGSEVQRGKTGEDGVIDFPYLPGAGHEIHAFDTKYVIRLYGNLDPMDKEEGLQKRLDILGYVTGYLQDSIGDALPSSISIPKDPRGQQGVMNFQADHGLALDGIVGVKTREAISTAVKG